MTETTTDLTHHTIAKIVATHCCICKLKLTDAESVEHGIGPICSRKYYNPVHVPNEEQIKVAIGLLVQTGLPDVVVDQCLQFSKESGGTDARKFSNALVYYASSKYDNREEVLKCSAIIRVLGYVELADKLEQDRVQAVVLNKVTHFEAFFHDTYEIVKALKKIPGIEELHEEVVREDTRMIPDPSQKPVTVKERVKLGKKYGWKIPEAGRDHLKCILGVFLGGKLISYGNSVLKTCRERPRRDLYAFENPAGANPQAARAACSVTREGYKLHVRTPYNEAFNADLRALPKRDRRFLPDLKCWEVDVRHEAAVQSMIQKHYP